MSTAFVTYSNPAGVAAPASAYSHAAIHPLGNGAMRLVMSGQIGVTPQGAIAQGYEAQMAQAWDNVLTILGAHGMGPTDVVKITCYSTLPGIEATASYRAMRDARLAGHRPASTYVVVAGLAHPDLMFEVECEAVRAS
jgi:enamine deaminase RidA (YjgF/YER057c/UK114 family)